MLYCGKQVVQALRYGHPIIRTEVSREVEDEVVSKDVVPMHVSFSGHTSTFLDLSHRGLSDGVVRSSVHYYNTERELEAFCQRLKSLSKSSSEDK